MVFRARPDRPQNRHLAAFLLLTALAETFGSGLRFLVADERTAYAAWTVTFVGLAILGMPFLLAFYGTLPAPWLRPLRSPVVLGVAFAVAGATAAAVVAAPTLAGRSLVLVPELGVYALSELGPIWRTVVAVDVAILLLGIVATATAVRHASTAAERAKLRALAVAFAASNALLVAALAVSSFVGSASGAGVAAINFFGKSLANIVLVALCAYGVLRSQLFDVDLRLKWTLRQSTVAAIVVAVAFVASEAAQQLLSAEAGPWVGILAAGALVFAIAPLQRAAERVADAAMPRVRASEDYLAQRKAEVFRAALEGAYRDGEVTPKEREILTSLQLELGIPNAEARAMEREAAVGASAA